VGVRERLSGCRSNAGYPEMRISGDIMVEIVRYYLNVLALKTGRGQGLVEYALILVLISVTAVAILNALGVSITSVFSRANSSLTAP
jgi:pilus assembly protein Flp/PilA